MSNARRNVMIFNASDDTMDTLEDVLGREGYVCVRSCIRDFRRGTRDLSAFLREHDPSVVVWDISVPYGINWSFLEQSRRTSTPLLHGRGLVVTTTNAARLADIVGPHTGAIEISDGQKDLQALVDAVQKHLMTSSPT